MASNSTIELQTIASLRQVFCYKTWLKIWRRYSELDIAPLSLHMTKDANHGAVTRHEYFKDAIEFEVKDLWSLAIECRCSRFYHGSDKSAWEVQNFVFFYIRIYGRFVEGGHWPGLWPSPDLVLRWHHGSKSLNYDLYDWVFQKFGAMTEATAALPTGQRNVYWDRNQSKLSLSFGKVHTVH